MASSRRCVQMGGKAVLQSVRAKPLNDTPMAFRTPDFDSLTSDLSEAGCRYLMSRGFSREVLDQNEIRTAHKSFKVDGKFETKECIAIPYKRDGDVVSVKYRSIEGAFSSLTHAARNVWAAFHTSK